MSETSDPHLRDHVLAAYVDGTLAASARAMADTHLVECVACRDELVAMSSLVRSSSRSRRVVRFAAPTAAVAAALLVAVLGPWRAAPRSSTPNERLRETTSVAAGPRVMPVGPTEGGMIDQDSVRFIWRSEPRDAGYRLTVTDEGGAVRWTMNTSDTAVGLPDSVRLDRGRTYYWYVDALGRDGRTRTSGLRRFRVAP